MKITKKEAVELSKALHQYQYTGGQLISSDHLDTLIALNERLEEYLVAEVEETDEEVEEDEDSEEDSSSESDEEDDEDKAESEEASDDADAEEDDEEELEADYLVEGDALHNLIGAKSTDGTIEFELIDMHDVEGDDDDQRVDLVLEGYTEINDVTHVRRKSKELHVRDADGEWTIFEVSKFPKSWTSTFPLGGLVEVEY